MNSILAFTLALVICHPTDPYYISRRGVDPPSGFLWRDHSYLIQRIPDLHFEKELDALLETHLSHLPRSAVVTVDSETVEREDAMEALEARGVEESERLQALNGLLGARNALPKVDGDRTSLWAWEGPKQGVNREGTAKADSTLPPVDFAPFESMVVSLPEFLLYLKGVAAYRQEKYREAIVHWDTLLSAPDDMRTYKSTWAAYMLGRAWLHIDTKRAIPWFEKTRELADSGFRDPLGFRTASLGWQAFAELQTDEPAAAIRHYAEQYKTGTPDERASAFNSFHHAIRAVFKDDTLPEAVLVDPLVREIVTVAILSKRGPERSPRTWAINLETRQPEVAKAMAGWMAVLYFMDSDYGSANVWADRASADDFYAQWVKLKCNLRNGYFYPYGYEIEALLDLYRRLLDDGDLRALRYPEIALALSNELGVIQQNRGMYIPALQAFLNGGNYVDAAYIAECVLTCDELNELMPRLTEIQPAPTYGRNWQEPVDPRKLLSGILARKLARVERYEEAAQLEPELAYLEFEGLLTNGRNPRHERRLRAESLFLAAEMARNQGLELFGTHFAPDWGLYWGNRVPTGRDRVENGTAHPVEAMRINSNRPYPNRRFHYKWKAADLMWECAQLLPNNDELLAQALWYGGTYIAIEDPEGADKFYKALVRRCGKLPIGKEADTRRWFPPKPPEWPYPADRAWSQ